MKDARQEEEKVGGGAASAAAAAPATPPSEEYATDEENFAARKALGLDVTVPWQWKKAVAKVKPSFRINCNCRGIHRCLPNQSRTTTKPPLMISCT